MFKWDEESVKNLSGKLDVKDSSGMVPLHHAIKQKAPFAVIQSLVQACPDTVSVKDLDGKLPLHYAAERNLGADILTLLLSNYPRSIRERDDKGMLPLHHLVRFCSDLEVVKAFTGPYPESIRERDRDGWLPLHFAARDNGSREVIEHLIIKYAGGLCEKSNHGSLPIHCAAHYNNSTSVLQYLADQHPSSLSQGGNKGMWPVHCAARNNPCLDVIKLLIKLLPTSVMAEDEEQRLPLHHSIRNISINVVKYLIDLYPQALKCKDANGWLPVHTASRFSMNLDVVSLIVGHYKEGLKVLDEEEWLPMHHAARNNLSLDVIKYLIRQYPDAMLFKAVSVGKYAYELAPENSDKKVFLSLLFTAMNREAVQSLGVVRLHLIGDGYAGKTVCSKWIKELISLTMLNWQSIDLFDSAMEVSMTDRTRGMETTYLSHSVTLTDNRITHYLIHDYAGQQEYLINHAAFLNQSDSVYVLVLPLYDKVKKAPVPFDRLVARAMFWLKFLYSSTHQRYPHGIPVCIVLNTFEADVSISSDQVDVARRRIMAAARRLYSFQPFSDHIAGVDEKRIVDFVLVGDEILPLDARMKFSVKLLIDSLKTAANHYTSNGLSRQSKLQAYCWEILNLLNLSIVMREEDLQFMVTSTIKSFFNKQLQTYLLAQTHRERSPTEEEEAHLGLLKEMKARSYIVTQVEELLTEYIMEILQALGKIFLVKQQRQKLMRNGEQEEEDSSTDTIVITSPHDLSHTILGHLYGNLRSFAGNENSTYDLILKPSQLQLMLTYLPVMPVTVPRLLVLLGVCIPVHYNRERQVVCGVFDPPEYNPAYTHPPRTYPSSASQGLGAGAGGGATAYSFANYSLPGSNGASYNPNIFNNAIFHHPGMHAPPPPPPSSMAPAIPPPPLPMAPAPLEYSAEEKSYWAIGLIQKSITAEVDFSKTRLLSCITHAVTRVYLLSNSKYMLIPGFFVKLFVFLYDLEPNSVALHVYKDGFNLVAKKTRKALVRPRRSRSKHVIMPAELPPPPPPPPILPSAHDAVVPTPSFPQGEGEMHHDDALPPESFAPRGDQGVGDSQESVEETATDGQPPVAPAGDMAEQPAQQEEEEDEGEDEEVPRLPSPPEAPEPDDNPDDDDDAEGEGGEGDELVEGDELCDYYKQLLVLPYRDGDKVGFQLTVGTSLPHATTCPVDEDSDQNYCMSVLLKVRQYLLQEMWGIELQEFCLCTPTFNEDDESVVDNTMRKLPENKFYRSNIYGNLFNNANLSDEVTGVGIGFDITPIEACEDYWFRGTEAQRDLVREQLFGYLDPIEYGPSPREEQDGQRLVPLHCRIVRPLPLLGPYSTYATAVESLARCFLLADLSKLTDADIQGLALTRIRDIGMTSKRNVLSSPPTTPTTAPTPATGAIGSGISLLAGEDTTGVGLLTLADTLSLSIAHLRELSSRVRERYEALLSGMEMENLLRRDVTDLPLLPVITMCQPVGRLFTREGDWMRDEADVRVQDYTLHFLCPVCGQKAPSGRDGQGYKLSLASKHASPALLQTLSYTLSMCEALVHLVQSNRTAAANTGALLAMGALLQDTMDVVLRQHQAGLQINVERTHRLQNSLFQLMKDFLIREQQHLLLAQAGASHTGHSAKQHQQARLGLLGKRNLPLVSEEDQHLVNEIAVDPRYARGLVDLLLAVDDQHLLHTGLQRVVSSTGAIAWVCSSTTENGPADLYDAVNQGLTSLTEGVAKMTAGQGAAHSEPSKKRQARFSSCYEEFMRRGSDCLALKLKL